MKRKKSLIAISVGLKCTEAGQEAESKPESELQDVPRVGPSLDDRLP